MTRREANKTLRRKLKNSPFCKICGGYIYRYDDFNYRAYYIGHRHRYEFFHILCEKGNNNEKTITQSASSAVESLG